MLTYNIHETKSQKSFLSDSAFSASLPRTSPINTHSTQEMSISSAFNRESTPSIGSQCAKIEDQRHPPNRRFSSSITIVADVSECPIEIEVTRCPTRNHGPHRVTPNGTPVNIYTEQATSTNGGDSELSKDAGNSQAAADACADSKTTRLSSSSQDSHKSGTKRKQTEKEQEYLDPRIESTMAVCIYFPLD